LGPLPMIRGLFTSWSLFCSIGLHVYFVPCWFKE
jgi:hypothetical protein